MQIAWTNRADDAALTTDSELATLPASNVQNAHVAQVWRTAESVKAAYLIFDLGSSLACDLVALLGTNLTSAATIQVRASDADPTVTSSLLLDTGVDAGGVDDNYGALYKDLGSITARYWRIDLSDTTVESNLAVGRVFLGPSWTPSINMMVGVAWMSQDPSLVAKSRAGQRHAERLPQQRVIAFELDFMGEAEMFNNAFALARAAGVIDDILVIPDIASSYLSQQAVWGTCQASQPLVNDKLGLYRQKFTVEERL